MDHSMPGLPVHHQILEFTQTHVHFVGDVKLFSLKKTVNEYKFMAYTKLFHCGNTFFS